MTSTVGPRNHPLSLNSQSQEVADSASARPNVLLTEREQAAARFLTSHPIAQEASQKVFLEVTGILLRNYEPSGEGLPVLVNRLEEVRIKLGILPTSPAAQKAIGKVYREMMRMILHNDRLSLAEIPFFNHRLDQMQRMLGIPSENSKEMNRKICDNFVRDNPNHPNSLVLRASGHSTDTQVLLSSATAALTPSEMNNDVFVRGLKGLSAESMNEMIKDSYIFLLNQEKDVDSIFEDFGSLVKALKNHGLWNVQQHLLQLRVLVRFFDQDRDHPNVSIIYKWDSSFEVNDSIESFEFSPFASASSLASDAPLQSSSSSSASLSSPQTVASASSLASDVPLQSSSSASDSLSSLQTVASVNESSNDSAIASRPVASLSVSHPGNRTAGSQPKGPAQRRTSAASSVSRNSARSSSSRDMKSNTPRLTAAQQQERDRQRSYRSTVSSRHRTAGSTSSSAAPAPAKKAVESKSPAKK